MASVVVWWVAAAAAAATVTSSVVEPATDVAGIAPAAPPPLRTNSSSSSSSSSSSPPSSYCTAIRQEGFTILTSLYDRRVVPGEPATFPFEPMGCAVFREAVAMLARGLADLGFPVNTLCCYLGTDHCENGDALVFRRQVRIDGWHCGSPLNHWMPLTEVLRDVEHSHPHN